MIPPPFARTVCACPACVAHCTTKPGYLILRDVVRLADFLVADGRITRLHDVLDFLRASPGALVAKQGKRFRIGTIVPKMKDGRCVFLSPDDRCTVHAVAPFGCSFFDAHMNSQEGDRRSTWGLHQVLNDHRYTILRDMLVERDQLTERTP